MMIILSMALTDENDIRKKAEDAIEDIKRKSREAIAKLREGR